MKPNQTMGHLEIEIVEKRPLLGRAYFYWRTRYIQNGQIGVTSETYRDRRDVERSIRAHRNYLGTCGVFFIGPDGRRAQVHSWAEQG